MVDLSDVLGLPVYLDEETGEISYENCVSCESKTAITLSDLVPVLLNKYLKYPEQIYSHFRRIMLDDDKDVCDKKVSLDLVKVPYGLLGIEYLKTHIYYTKRAQDKYCCMVQLISGELTLILQKNSDEQIDYSLNTIVEEIEIIKLKKGDRIAIPTGYFFTFVNTGANQAIFVIISALDLTKVDYTILQKEKGLAFYIISKNARLEVVANPKYKVSKKPIPKIWADYAEDIKAKFTIPEPDTKEPLYNVFKNNLQVFEEAMVF